MLLTPPDAPLAVVDDAVFVPSLPDCLLSFDNTAFIVDTSEFDVSDKPADVLLLLAAVVDDADVVDSDDVADFVAVAEETVVVVDVVAVVDAPPPPAPPALAAAAGGFGDETFSAIESPILLMLFLKLPNTEDATSKGGCSAINYANFTHFKTEK